MKKLCGFECYVFVFKQKTADELHISDWSSDVCSSDLWVIDTPLQPELDADIRKAYAQLCNENRGGDVAVAVRSSATAEDLPDASFAGQQETFLNVTGADDVVRKVKEVFASLYNDQIGRASCRGKSVSVRVELGGRRILKKKKK